MKVKPYFPWSLKSFLFREVLPTKLTVSTYGGKVGGLHRSTEYEKSSWSYAIDEVKVFSSVISVASAAPSMVLALVSNLPKVGTSILLSLDPQKKLPSFLGPLSSSDN